MSLLNATGLDGGYDALTVFRDVNLNLAHGEIVGILGVNGAGKTTLLKTLAGLLRPSRGTVTLDGQDLTARPAYERARAGLVLVPEGRQVIAGLSVIENLELTRASGRAGAGKDAYRRKVAEIWTQFPRLQERAGQPAGSLSGGEQQMLAVARALMMDPVALMLDEPTQGLAPVIVIELRDVLRRLAGRFGILVVEQNRAFVESLVTRVGYMQGGRLQFAS